MNKPVYLGLAILKISKIVIYEFWYDQAKLKYKKKKLCYMGTDSFNLHIYMNITEDTERRFDTSNQEGERQLPREKIKM